MTSTSRRIAIGGAVLGAMLATGLGGAPALAKESHTVRLLNAHDKVIAQFHTAKCRKGRGTFHAATKVVHGYRIFVTADDFSGFRTDYELLQGHNADPYVTVTKRGSDVSYSSLNEPPFPVQAFGSLLFRRGGKLMGMAYSPALSRDATDAVTFTGVVRCQFPKKRR